MPTERAYPLRCLRLMAATTSLSYNPHSAPSTVTWHNYGQIESEAPLSGKLYEPI